MTDDPRDARIRELETEVARLQEDVALGRQITKGFDHILGRVCAVIGASEGDDPVAVAERRMEEITSCEDACNDEAARIRKLEARLAQAEKAIETWQRAHETGRYEPCVAAYESARAFLQESK